jgi:hypothetical protein
MAASQVDTTFPADNEKVDKADFRAQMVIIQSELTDTLRKTSLAWKISIGDISIAVT